MIENYLNDLAHQVTQPMVPNSAQVVFDGLAVEAKDAASQYELTNLRLLVASALIAWAETDDLQEGETPTDRLNALFMGIVDLDKDGEVTSDEADYLDMALNVAVEWLQLQGVTNADIDALLNDDDDDVAENVMELLAGVLPDGDDAIEAAINEFAGLGAVMDGAVMDAMYKKVTAVRNGQKVKIKKRISGKVRLTSAQKQAIKKAQRKSHNGAARMKRAKSMRKRAKLGM
ncbi:hypothetical protein [Vitreoscilla stercoraria]|uniref:EF-hand domain-containing protein n=1 Tax=Vitreoscilla stercoraria TaxID=61 RepID=A0ABY4ECB7_VITST|nr:hypothetical protein [Vitreoscilla stercoraria]UOO93398.1 hypothetical protein LVJ81_05050 [Vitreoscilla stercoraria]